MSPNGYPTSTGPYTPPPSMPLPPPAYGYAPVPSPPPAYGYAPVPGYYPEPPDRTRMYAWIIGGVVAAIVAVFCIFFFMIRSALVNQRAAERRNFVSQSGEASALLSTAQSTAAAQNKQVLVVFHASWCPDCRHLDRWMARPAVKPIIDSHYVVLWLDEFEKSDSDVPENDGAADMMSRMSNGGADGIPFEAVFDQQGNVAGDPAITQDGDDYGWPVTDKEMDGFVGALHAATPGLTDTELSTLRSELEAANDGASST